VDNGVRMSRSRPRRRKRLTHVALRTQTDRRLVELTRSGHVAAFEEVVRRHRAGLVEFAGSIVPFDRAEDVVQSAFIKAQDAIVDGDQELELRPWLFTIVRNKALNDLRDQPTYEHLDEDYDGVPQPPEVAVGRQRVKALIAALMALPAVQREAIVKRELEGRGHDEIAAELGTTAAAVRGLIFRARTNLRRAAGLLLPTPALRFLLASPAAEVGSAGTLAEGWLGAKTVGLAALAAAALGGGIAVQSQQASHGGGTGADGTAHASAAPERAVGSAAGAADRQLVLDRSGSGDGDGSGNSGPGGDGDSSGPGGDGDRPDDKDDDNSGPGSKPGKTEEEDDDEDVDDDMDTQDDPTQTEESRAETQTTDEGGSNSGSGSGSSGSSGSGSGGSGSGSGSSGSGSDGSGSEGSGSGSGDLDTDDD